MSTSPPTAKQCKEVQDVLKQPLTGRQVMIPMTTKAFFPGTLQPKIVNGEEHVVMNLGNEKKVEISRSEAIRLLEEKQASITAPSSATRKPKYPIAPATQIPPTIATTTDPSKEVIEKQESNASSLPYFEIREEYNDKGKEISAKAINVTKQLDFLQQNLDPSKGAQEVVPAAAVTDKPQVESNQEESSHYDEISDEQYASLSSRLDELARLEEEAEHGQRLNKKSSKKLQSKGWKKGFLDTRKKAKNPVSTKDRKAPVATSSAASTMSLEGSNATKRVGFQKTNQVFEIPRIGQRSAAELKPLPAAVKEKGISSAQRQLEKEVFSGVVVERPMSSTPVRSADHPSQQQPKRKLSRFALERQQRNES